MKIVLKILGLGTAHPLTLSMGHPVHERIQRLVRKRVWRGGRLIVGLVIGGGLTLTGMAKASDEMALDDVTVKGEAFLIKYHNLESGRETMTVEFSEQKIEFRLFRKNDEFSGADVVDEDGPILKNASLCLQHIAGGNALPLVYKAQGKMIKTDSKRDNYILECIPGTPAQRAGISAAQYRASVQKSPHLTSLEKAEWIEHMEEKNTAP